MYPRRLVSILVLVVAVSGCSRRDPDVKWPTLAPRPGEVSPLVPRTPLGACPGCGQDLIAAPVTEVAAPLPAVAADVAGRIAAVEGEIAGIEAAYPAQMRTTNAAIAAAARGDEDAVGEAEVQRSRLEALFLPLAIQGRALDSIDDDLAGRADTAALAGRVAALRERIAALQAVRDGI